LVGSPATSKRYRTASTKRITRMRIARSESERPGKEEKMQRLDVFSTVLSGITPLKLPLCVLPQSLARAVCIRCDFFPFSCCCFWISGNQSRCQKSSCWSVVVSSHRTRERKMAEVDVVVVEPAVCARRKAEWGMR
jgi:hypothetical protein